MRRRRNGWAVHALAVMAVLVGVAGCGGGGAPSAGVAAAESSPPPLPSSSGGVTSSGAASAAASSPAASAAPTPSPAAGGSVVVPVTLAPSTVAALDGALIATVQITVGGGAPVTVRLDTGSSGLLLASGAAGPGTTDTGRAVSTEFGGSTASGTLGQAVVELGGVSTAAPIGVTLVDTSAGAPGTFAGTDGMLGVGTGNSSTTAAGDVYAPTLQLPGTAAQGVTLDLTGSGGGTMTLGPVTAPAGATVLPMSRMTGTPATYPNGAVGYDRLVSLCWTVGTAPNACAPTDLDLGNPVFGLNATTFASLGALDTFLPAGQAVSISAPGAAAPLWSTTSAAPASPEALLLTGLGDATYNTGIGLFQRAVVGIDYAAGRFVVQPAG